MKAYSEDLHQKIVSTIERGMPKAQAARTFGVGISTVERYATKARRGESLERGKAPGKPPKMGQPVSKVLEEDLKERSFATRQERCEYVRAVSRVSVSLRKAAARTKEALVEAIGAALSAVTIAEASCERKIFCERLPEVAARAGKTDRLEEALLAIASEMGEPVAERPADPSRANREYE